MYSQRLAEMTRLFGMKTTAMGNSVLNHRGEEWADLDSDDDLEVVSAVDEDIACYESDRRFFHYRANVSKTTLRC